jgi:hypothetical protein
MIKSTAVTLGFLFGLSITYYLSFWTSFDIDVFQYLAIEDIIKGVAYPLRYAGVWLVVAVALVGFMVAVSTIDKPEKEAERVLWGFFGLSLLLGIIFEFLVSNQLIGITFSIVFSILITVIYFVLDMQHTNKVNAATLKKPFNEQNPVTVFLNVITVFAFVFLPINAIVAGQADARGIIKGKRYNYILAKDLPKDEASTKQPYLIFLGAISEKYIFIERNEGERFIVDKEKLPVLRIHHFDSSDKRTIMHLNACLNRQIGLPRK